MANMDLLPFLRKRQYNTFAFQSCDIEVPAVGTGSTSIYNKVIESQVMQLAEHNTEVTEIVHCYQNEI